MTGGEWARLVFDAIGRRDGNTERWDELPERERQKMILLGEMFRDQIEGTGLYLVGEGQGVVQRHGRQHSRVAIAGGRGDDAVSPEAMARILVAFELERRPERPYDEQDAGHLIRPNGALCDSFDRSFLGAAGRAVQPMYATPRLKEHAA